MKAAIGRSVRFRPGLGELLAGLGGVILLVALLAPIEWFEEVSSGGLAGEGTGEPARSLTAWDELGLWLALVALAAATPLVELALNRTGRSIPSTMRLLVVSAGLVVLAAGVVSELTYSVPPCCDQAYWKPSAKAGLVLAALGAGLLALGTLMSLFRHASRRKSALAVALLTAIMVAGCGDDKSGSKQPGGSSELQSGVIEGSYELRITPQGGEQASSGRISFSGPFEEADGDGLPSFDLAVRMQQTDERDVEFGMIATADAGYIEFQGQGYEIDEAVFERLGSATPFAGLDASQWFASPSKEGREEIDGTETIHTSGEANVARILSDLEQATKQIGLRPGNLEPTGRFPGTATLDLYVGAQDGILRRLDLSVARNDSSEDTGRFRVVHKVSLTLSEVNEDQEIDAPEESAPFDELVEKLPLELSGLGEFLSR